MNIPVSNAVNSVAEAQPDYIAIAMVVILALIVIAMVIRKHLMLKRSALKCTSEDNTTAQAAEKIPAATAAPGTAGDIKLYDVDPRTAAMLMAIVADSTGIPLNELRFISVREVK